MFSRGGSVSLVVSFGRTELQNTNTSIFSFANTLIDVVLYMHTCNFIHFLCCHLNTYSRHSINLNKCFRLNFIGMMFQLSLTDKLKSHLQSIASTPNSKQPILHPASQSLMSRIPNYSKSSYADNISTFHGRELRRVPDAKGHEPVREDRGKRGERTDRVERAKYQGRTPRGPRPHETPREHFRGTRGPARRGSSTRPRDHSAGPGVPAWQAQAAAQGALSGS